MGSSTQSWRSGWSRWKHEDRASATRGVLQGSSDTASPSEPSSGALYGVDLTALLPTIRVPALVVATDNAWIELRDDARVLATGLPNAELRHRPR